MLQDAPPKADRLEFFGGPKDGDVLTGFTPAEMTTPVISSPGDVHRYKLSLAWNGHRGMIYRGIVAAE